MKARTLGFGLILPVLSSFPLSADLYITNFESAAGGIAAGVWRNATTATDTGITVGLFHSGNSVFDEGTVLDGSFPWQDFLGNLFEPNYDGDYVSLEVPGGGDTQVVIDFGAEVVNPVLHFTDVDIQTQLVFSTANPVAVAGLANLLVLGNTVQSAGFSANPFDPFDLETLGSLQFTGTFTTLEFTIDNSGASPTEDDDRTGFSVSTLVEPVPVMPLVLPQLDIWQAGGRIYVSWPDTTTFSELEYSMDLTMMSWVPLPGADPTTTTDWNAPLSDFGGDIYIRGRYSF